MEKAIQLSIPLPRSLDSRIYIHMTVRPKSVQLFLTTASAEELTAAAPLGSFVYALPDVCQTALVTPRIPSRRRY